MLLFDGFFGVAVGFVQHPSGVIEINIEIEKKGDVINVKKVGTVRTVRKIMEGKVFD